MSAGDERRDAVRRMGLRFLSAFLNERLPAMLGMERVAGSKGRRARQVGTSLGEVTLRRAYVPGRGCPPDEALGLVDFFHAGEHLMELCRLQCPGKDGKAAEERFGMRRRMLKAHGAASLIRYFEEHGPQSPNAAAIVRRLEVA